MGVAGLISAPSRDGKRSGEMRSIAQAGPPVAAIDV
jgi:hypothetical protein